MFQRISSGYQKVKHHFQATNQRVRVNPHQADVSESLIRQGRGKCGPRRKSAISAIFFAFETSKIISRDSRDARAAPYRVQDQPWSFIVPYRVLVIFKILNQHCRNSNDIMEYVYGHLFTLPRLREPSWTITDTQMDPARLILGNLVEKGPSRVLPGSKLISFLNRSLNKRQT